MVDPRERNVNARRLAFDDVPAKHHKRRYSEYLRVVAWVVFTRPC